MHNSAPPLERGKHDKDSRQQAFIEAATAVFAEKGYANATTREVAERAGCSEGLIHRYFGGKRGLLLALLEHKSGSMTESVGQELWAEEDPGKEIEAFVLWKLDHVREHADPMRVSLAQGIIDPEIGRFIGERIGGEHVGAICDRLAHHQRAGRIDARADVEAAAQLISSAAFQFGFILQIVFGEDLEEVRRMAQASAKIIMRGLAPATPSTAGDGRDGESR